MSKLLSIDMADGLYERMKRMKKEKESLSCLIERALDALDAFGDVPQTDVASLESRLKALELSVDVIIERRIERNEARLKTLEEQAFADLFVDMTQDAAGDEVLQEAPKVNKMWGDDLSPRCKADDSVGGY
ncbi:MAG: hypothetical protein WCP34_03610 [Pseudomonadota bacterium]